MIVTASGTKSHTRLFTDSKETLGQNDHLFAGDVVFLQGLRNRPLRCAIRVCVGGIPSIQPPIISRLQKRKCLRITFLATLVKDREIAVQYTSSSLRAQSMD